MKKGMAMVLFVILASAVAMFCNSVSADQQNSKLLLLMKDTASVNRHEVATRIAIYGVPCPEEPRQINQSISQWVIDNVKVVKPANMVVNLGQIIYYVAKAQYDASGKWRGLKVTKIVIQ